MTVNDDEFRRVVTRFRGEQVVGLRFEPAVEGFLDADVCADLCREFTTGEFHWERKSATPNLAASLPRQNGIYMFVWVPGLTFEFHDGKPPHDVAWVLYVGKAGIGGGENDTFRDRYRSEYQHYVGRDPTPLWAPAAESLARDKRLARYLVLRPLQYWYLPVTKVEYIPILEKRLLRLFRPPLNTQHIGPRARVGKPGPAW